ADFRMEKDWQAPADVQLLSMFPHGHWRARSFRYEAIYPDGSREILLDVPRYDFTWQNAYILAEPKRLPKGTIVHCLARYDNSSGNPVLPDLLRFISCTGGELFAIGRERQGQDLAGVLKAGDRFTVGYSPKFDAAATVPIATARGENFAVRRKRHRPHVSLMCLESELLF